MSGDPSVIVCANACEANEKLLSIAAKFGMQNQKKGMHPIFIIVPDRFTLQAEKILLTHAPVLLNVRVVTFSMLFHIISPNTDVLDKTSAVLFMWRAIRDVRGELGHFGSCVDQYAFAEKMFNTINQLESSRADFKTLEKNARSAVTKQKMRDISLIHARYKELCKGTIDSSGVLGWMIDNVAKSEIIKDAHVYVTGFEYVSIQREEVLKRIAGVARSFTVGARAGCELLGQLV